MLDVKNPEMTETETALLELATTRRQLRFQTNTSAGKFCINYST